MTTDAWVEVEKATVIDSAKPINYSHLDDEMLLTAYAERQVQNTIAVALLGRMEQELIHRMTERGATAIPSETFICQKEVKNTYDQATLTPLLEIFNTVELEKCYEAAYSETVEVPAKWKVQQVLAAAKRRGAEALAVVERAKLPGAPRLRFERRTQEEK